MIAERGVPQAIRSDNGPEFTSRHFLAWCAERKIELVHIEPGKPVQNAHVESFHGKLRDECRVWGLSAAARLRRCVSIGLWSTKELAPKLLLLP